MADNSMTKNITGGSAKQKLILAVIAAIVLIVIWQIVGLFSGGSSTAPTPPAAPAKTPKMTAMTAAAPTSSAVSTGGTPSVTGAPTPPASPQGPTPAVTTLQTTDAESLLAANSALLKQQQQEQATYLNQVDKLQSLKVEREIAETSQAIAAARLATATAEQDMSNLLTKPSLSASDYASRLAAGSPQSTTSATGMEIPVANKPQPAIVYVLVSVTEQLDKWSAVLGYQGKLISVSVGDVLPADGSTVIAIDTNSITLMTKDHIKHKINITTSI